MGTQKRSVNQNVKSLASGRSHSRLAAGRRRYIAGRVGSWLSLVVDPVELLFRVPREDEVVMHQMLVGAVEAKI
jgi:hypothetical protein